MSISVPLRWSRARQKEVQATGIAAVQVEPNPYAAQLQKIIALCECDPREAYRAHLKVGMEILEEKLSPVHCMMVADFQADCERELASLKS